MRAPWWVCEWRWCGSVGLWCEQANWTPCVCAALFARVCCFGLLSVASHLVRLPCASSTLCLTFNTPRSQQSFDQLRWHTVSEGHQPSFAPCTAQHDSIKQAGNANACMTFLQRMGAHEASFIDQKRARGPDYASSLFRFSPTAAAVCLGALHPVQHVRHFL